MKEFNYRRAWSEYANPSYEALPDNVKEVYKMVLDESDHLTQDRRSLITIGESPKLRAAFDILDPAILALASEIIYRHGHWASYKKYNSRGQHWKFQSLACQSIERRKRFDLLRTEKEKSEKIIDDYMDHKEGTQYSDDEIVELIQHSGLSIQTMKLLSVHCVNFKPHPFVIGNAHLRNSHSIYLDPESAPCAQCHGSYKDHTYDRVLFVNLLVGEKMDEKLKISDRDWERLKNEMQSIEAFLASQKAVKINGFTFVER